LYVNSNTTTISNSNITSNSAGGGTLGGGINNAGGTVNVDGTNITASTNKDCVGAITDNGGNTDSDDTCGFIGADRTLSVTVNGNGVIVSTPAGIDCFGPYTCSATFTDGTSVTLTSRDFPDMAFMEWGGACADTWRGTDCVLTMDSNKSATGTFVDRNGRADLSPTSLVFGSQDTGSGGAKSVTLTNNSTVTQSVGAVSTSSPYSIINDTCSGTTLPGGGSSCTFGVSFDPPDNMTYTGSADVTMSGEGSAAGFVSLAGTTNNPPGQPVLISPVDGDSIGSPVTFIWGTNGTTARMNAMTDGDGDEITYTVDICADPGQTNCQTHTASARMFGPGSYALAGIAMIGLVSFTSGRRRKIALMIAAAMIVAFSITTASCGNSSSSGESSVGSTATPTGSITVDLTSGDYYWSVTATDSQGASTKSDVMAVSVQ
jgi:hypothetical protein